MRPIKLYFLVFLVTILSKVALAKEIKSEIENKIYSKINDFAQNVGEEFGENLTKYENLKHLDFSINIMQFYSHQL